MWQNNLKLPDISDRTLVLATLVITSVSLFFWLLTHYYLIVLLLIAAIIISVALEPAVNWLHQRGLPRGLSIALIYATFLLLGGAFLWYSVPVILRQGADFVTTLNEGYQNLRAALNGIPNILLRRITGILPADLSELLPLVSNSVVTGEEGAEAAPPITLGSNVMLPVQLIIVLALAFFWTLENARIKQSLFLLVPVSRRDSLRQLISRIEDRLARYVQGQLMLCLAIAILALVAYLLIGLPNALILAAFAGLMEAIPIVGPFLGAIPAMMIGLSASPTAAIWVLVATGIIQQLENSFLVPHIMKRALGISPLVALLSLLGFGTFFGILGAIISIPMAAVIQLIWEFHWDELSQDKAAATGRDQLSLLRYQTTQLIADMQEQYRARTAMEEADNDLVEETAEAIAADLATLLQQQQGEQLP
ncbi:MAG: AI-2E family transporter [Anaerolineales bacterium]|nr:AI-2E family transporter [Anaerolineales bacterium]